MIKDGMDGAPPRAVRVGRRGGWDGHGLGRGGRGRFAKGLVNNRMTSVWTIGGVCVVFSFFFRGFVLDFWELNVKKRGASVGELELLRISMFEGDEDKGGRMSK